MTFATSERKYALLVILKKKDDQIVSLFPCSTDEKDDDQSQTDVQYPTSLETKVVTSTITEEIIPPSEGTNSPSQVIITTTKETTSHTSQNTTDVIDNTETEIERESNIESNIDSEDSTDYPSVLKYCS